MSDEHKLQISLSLGGGKPVSVLTNFRGDNDEEVVERLAAIGTLLVPITRDVESTWNATAPARPTPQGDPAPAVSHAQAVAAVAQGLGGTPVAPPSGRPGDGELYPGKFCELPDCGAQRIVVDRVKNGTNKRYRKLECSANYKHPADWTENYK